jgi:hypothetical protein
MSCKLELRTYGFVWGPVEVVRNCVTNKDQVLLGVKTKKADLMICVTQTGKVRILDKDGEWHRPLRFKEKQCTPG